MNSVHQPGVWEHGASLSASEEFECREHEGRERTMRRKVRDASSLKSLDAQKNWKVTFVFSHIWEREGGNDCISHTLIPGSITASAPFRAEGTCTPILIRAAIISAASQRQRYCHPRTITEWHQLRDMGVIILYKPPTHQQQGNNIHFFSSSLSNLSLPLALSSSLSFFPYFLWWVFTEKCEVYHIINMDLQVKSPP